MYVDLYFCSYDSKNLEWTEKNTESTNLGQLIMNSRLILLDNA